MLLFIHSYKMEKPLKLALKQFKYFLSWKHNLDIYTNNFI